MNAAIYKSNTKPGREERERVQREREERERMQREREERERVERERSEREREQELMELRARVRRQDERERELSATIEQQNATIERLQMGLQGPGGQHHLGYVAFVA